MEHFAFLNESHGRRNKIHDQLEVAVRGVVPVLKDHNLANTAKELERLLFELDVLEQEVETAIKSDPVGFLRTIAEMGKRR